MLEEKRLPLSARQEIIDNKVFGWKVQEEIEEGKGKHKEKYVLMTRDKNARNYLTLVNLEKEYYTAKGRIKEYKEPNEMVVMLLFVCLIIPGIVYLSKKKKEKNAIEEENAKAKKDMARIISEGEQYKR
jgi:hypothetical protein